MKYYNIRVVYGGQGEDSIEERFTFYSEKDEELADKDFDDAVKAINAHYKANGHFKYRRDVVNHFAKYGFMQIKL